MKKSHLLSITLLLALLAFGQAGCNSNNDSATNFKGLDVSLIPSAPPIEVSKDQSFPIMVSLENIGGYDLKKGEVKVFLQGIDSKIFSLSENDLSKSNTLDLKKGDSDSLISGGRERIVFSANAKYTGQNTDFVQPMNFVSCYDYESTVQTNICFISGESTVCSLDGEKLEGATISDAPIQITSITEQRSGKNVEVRFKIENKGEGKVYSPLADCSGPEIFLENSVLVNVESEEPFNCQPTLDGKKSGEGRIDSIISCKRDMQGSSDHLSPVKFNLRYKYVESTSTELGISS